VGGRERGKERGEKIERERGDRIKQKTKLEKIREKRQSQDMVSNG